MAWFDGKTCNISLTTFSDARAPLHDRGFGGATTHENLEGLQRECFSFPRGLLSFGASFYPKTQKMGQRRKGFDANLIAQRV